MLSIEGFFLNRERIWKAIADKIESELHKDVPARRALLLAKRNGIISEQASTDVCQWLQHYKVLMGIRGETRRLLVDAIVGVVRHIELFAAADIPKIVEAHNAVLTACSSVQSRDFTSLSSKVLWLLFPNVVPLFDSQAWAALRVVSRLVGLDLPKSKNKYSDFLHLHQSCLGELYQPIGRIVRDEFTNIFDVTTNDRSESLRNDAQALYSNHITVLDQLLWRLGA